ncbi:MAG: helix-hairpin-helix domain-containing protein [Clostridia bacterium]|nr:helix-hairpin-helix domain-containing protein [Clostridia bacterium]
MNRGNKAIGAILILAFICTAVVFVIEERKYIPNYIQFNITETETENVVNLNTATKEELMGLTGVGEMIAERIIEFRERIRPFETIQDVMLVKGFGETLFEDNKHLITVKQKGL